MKLKRNTIIFLNILFSSLFINNVTIYAMNKDNNVGDIHIKYDYEDNKKNDLDNNLKNKDNNIGILNIKEFNNYSKVKKTEAIQSDEYIKINSKLDKVVKLQNEKKYEDALSEIQKIANEYPEFMVFDKWVGIYQNRTKKFENSNETFENILLKFPLESEKINNDLTILFYKIDNSINIGEYDLAEKQLNRFKNNIDKNISNDDLWFDKNKKEIFNILYIYQKFILNYSLHNEENYEESLNELWNSIPKENHNKLDVFYGFNLDELEYIYGMYYNRKDILKAYVQQENSTDDKETINKIMQAKKVIFNKY